MKAIWRGKVIADSDRTIEVDGYHYFPRDSVRMERLRVSPKTESDRACPHGVQFYDLIGADGIEAPRSAWSYEAPKPSMAHVDHWLGFWQDVEIA